MLDQFAGRDHPSGMVHEVVETSVDLAGVWSVGETFDNLSAAPDGVANAVRFRRGWFLGDGTAPVGAGASRHP